MSAVLQDGAAASEVSSATKLTVRGMTCQNCVRHVREAISSVPGVSMASVDLEQQSASVRWAAETRPNVDAVVRAVNEAGYEADLAESRTSKADRHASLFSGWTLNLVVGLPVTILLALGEWVFAVAMERWFQWLAFGLATIVQSVCGARFYRGAWLQLKARSSNMDTLVALGSTTAYAYSIWALFQHTHVYFMEAAAIITLISAGHWLEARMSAHAASSMKKLIGLAPSQARRRTAADGEELVPVSELRNGEIIVLRPGERVPTDGVVVDGESSVDESMLTGESVPADKSPGAAVYGGTLNVNRLLALRVSATGEATALAQIIAAVERAQNSRANIQRLGDRVSSIFVPIVVLVAMATALWWGFAFHAAAGTASVLSEYLWHTVVPTTALAAAFVNCAAVLIVACPCAMGLATPAAIMAGTNAAAERGILIRDGIALEKAGTIRAIVFDKTGTLTQGKPEVAAHAAFSNDFDALAIACALAAHSNHPLSQAIAKWDGARTARSASSEKLTDSAVPPIGGWREQSGSGIEALLNAKVVRLGSMNWLTASGVDLSVGRPFIDEWTGKGASIVALALEKQLAAVFALRDPLKPGANEVVHALQRNGHAVYLVTGDNRRTALAAAQSLGITSENVMAEVRPEGKAEFVKSLQQGAPGILPGRDTQSTEARQDAGGTCHVAFIGDGINDAPALEQADLGIAVGRASDVAQMAADIVLLNSDVHAIPEALGLARATLRTIKQNLFWAFFYNALGIPLAALGFLSPILCAAAMGLSDTVVIGNALRLRWWKS
jgi:P-type Cu+ transporter